MLNNTATVDTAGYRRYMLPLVLCSVSFLAGGIAGVFGSLSVDTTAYETIGSYLQQFLNAADMDELEIPAILSLLWNSFRWLLFIWLLGLSVFGLIGVPLVMAFKAFSVSLSAAVFTKTMGGSGYVLSLILLGIPGIFLVPALFVAGVRSLACALSRLKGEEHGCPCFREQLYSLGFCSAALTLCTMAEYFIVPFCVSVLADML